MEEREEAGHKAVKDNLKFLFFIGIIGTAGITLSLFIKGFRSFPLYSGAILFLIVLVTLALALKMSRLTSEGERSVFTRFPERLRPFFTALIAGEAAAVLSGFIPEFLLPLGAASWAVSLLGGFDNGIFSLLIISATSMISCAEGGLYFFELFFAGFLLILLFRKQKREGGINLPLIIFLIATAASYAAILVFYQIDIAPDMVLFPALGLVLDSILILVILPKLRIDYIFREELLREEINDPEYELLRRLKRENNPEYMRSIHTAYLSDRVTDSIGADRQKARIIAYYSRIGVLTDEDGNIGENTLELISKEGFPEDIIKGMREFYGEPDTTLSREAAVVKLNSSLIDLIYKQLNREKVPAAKEKAADDSQKESGSADSAEEDFFDEDTALDFDDLIDKVALSLTKERFYLLSDLSIRDITFIKKRLKAEKLYFNFLK